MNTYYIRFDFLTDCVIEFRANSVEDACRQFYRYDLNELLDRAGNGDGPEITLMTENGVGITPDDPEWD